MIDSNKKYSVCKIKQLHKWALSWICHTDSMKSSYVSLMFYSVRNFFDMRKLEVKTKRQFSVGLRSPCVPAQRRRSSQWGGAGCRRSRRQRARQRTGRPSSPCPPSAPACSGSRAALSAGRSRPRRATPPPAAQRLLQDVPTGQLCLFVLLLS